MTSCSSSEDNAAQGDGHAKKALLVILDGWGIGDKSKPGSTPCGGTKTKKI